MTAKTRKLLKLIMTAGLIIPAVSAYSAPPFGLQPACDFRLLSLSAEQKAQWKQIRLDRKQQNTTTTANGKQNRRQHIVNLLTSSSFNEAAARHYAQERYSPAVNSMIADLAVQHRLFQVLTPQQREIWLQNCIQ